MAQKKRLKQYRELANQYGDPFEALFKRWRYWNSRGTSDPKAAGKAEALALQLIPYGHAKRAPVDSDGDAVPGQTVIFKLE